MYSTQAPSVTESQHSGSRLSVADILSSMANGVGESTAVTTFANVDGLTSGVPTRATPTLTPTTMKNIEDSFLEMQSIPPAPLEHQAESYFANVDGLTSGVPTRTTPTLTPTTMKNIEDSFLEMQSIPPAPLEHQHQAGFVPPVVNISGSSLVGQNANNYANQLETKEENEDWLPSCVQATYGTVRQTVTTSSAMTTSKPSGRNHGGRKPLRDEKLSPEEEERRRVRRERNKLAAARCRKRRMDHTNSLLIETEDLEGKRHALQNEIQVLTSQKEELEFLLEAHKTTCKMTHRRPDNKRPINGSVISTMANGAEKFSSQMKPLSRPTSLPVSSAFTNPDGSSALKVSTSFSDATGIPVSTPSSGIFNYESLMEGGTGLTPVSSSIVSLNSSCGVQQRSSSSELSSPDTMNPPPKLVSL